MNHLCRVLGIAAFTFLSIGGVVRAQDEVEFIVDNKSMMQIRIGNLDKGGAEIRTLSTGSNQRINVPKNSLIQFYDASINDPDKAKIGDRILANGRKQIIINNPGITYQISEMKCTEINSSEPGWEVEVAFLMDAKLKYESYEFDYRWKFGDSFDEEQIEPKTASNKDYGYVEVPYDDPDEPGEKRNRTFWKILSCSKFPRTNLTRQHSQFHFRLPKKLTLRQQTTEWLPTSK
ncbi:MAG: hypothetical protein R3C03_09120 [Pirellulaceae bacterium]